MNEINKILSDIQITLKAPKDSYNSFVKYKFRNCQSILENVKPLLEKHSASLILSDEVVAVNDRIYTKATATLSVGEESISSTAFAREAEEQKGMQPAQVSGSTSSYARKYALGGLLCLDDSEDDDSTNSHGKSNTPTPKPTTTTPPSKPDDNEMVEKIIAAFWTQVDTNGLEEKMEKAKKLGYGTRPDVVAAYEEIKIKLA